MNNILEGWREVKLGDVCAFQNGYAFKSNEFKNCGNINVIKIKELKNGLIDFTEDTSKILFSENYSKYIISKNDIVIALTGDPVSKNNPLSWVGRVSIYKSEIISLLNQRVARFVPKKEELSSLYIYYFFRDFNNFLNLAQKATGSASQANISTKTIEDTIINLPPLDEQERIAGVLGALDDKIELNNKINNNLEQQAQALFKSWFIDFEPFGGKMPSDWETTSLFNNPYCSFIKPGILEFGGSKTYIATADVNEKGIVNKSTNITYNDRPSRANMQPCLNSIWFAKMKDSRKNVLINDLWDPLINNFIFSTGFYGIKCTNDSLYYVWCIISSCGFDDIKNNLCNGTTMQAINNEGLAKIDIVTPTRIVVDEFNKLVSPLFESITSNCFENERLAELRDTLLPKLMSGEIDVSNVDISTQLSTDKLSFSGEEE